VLSRSRLVAESAACFEDRAADGGGPEIEPMEPAWRHRVRRREVHIVVRSTPLRAAPFTYKTAGGGWPSSADFPSTPNQSLFRTTKLATGSGGWRAWTSLPPAPWSPPRGHPSRTGSAGRVSRQASSERSAVPRAADRPPETECEGGTRRLRGVAAARSGRTRSPNGRGGRRGLRGRLDRPGPPAASAAGPRSCSSSTKPRSSWVSTRKATACAASPDPWPL
jgi:hypothetical protein